MSSNPITEEKSSDIKFKDELTDIASGSTIHGIANIFSTNSAFKRIIWIITFLACVTLVIRQLVDIFILYRSFPIITSVKHELYTEYPAFTVCNLNQYRHSKHDEFMRNMKKLVNEEFTRKLAHSTREELCRLDEIYCSMTSLLHNITRNYEYEMGYQIENMLYLCQLWRKSYHSCLKDNYTRWRSTRYGNCYTFELQTDVGIIDGIEGGINLIFNLEINENSTTDFEPGIRFVVHPRDVVAMPLEEGITIKGGERAFIGIAQTSIHRIQTPNIPCRTHDSHFGGIYDMKVCRQLCRETIIQEVCGCYEVSYESISLRTPSIIDTCRRTNFSKCSSTSSPMYHSPQIKKACFKRVLGDFTANPSNYCDCPVACIENNFVLSDERQPAFKPSIDLDMMLKDICRTKYGALTLSNCPLNRLKKENTLKENFVKIKVYFKEPAYDIWSEEASYDEIKMLADIGGSLGLFIGASVLSLGEILEVVAMCVRAFIRRRQNAIHTVD